MRRWQWQKAWARIWGVRTYSWWDVERATRETGKPLYELFDCKTGTLLVRQDLGCETK